MLRIVRFSSRRALSPQEAFKAMEAAQKVAAAASQVSGVKNCRLYLKSIGGQTEGFLEGIEPQITELLSALGCDPSDEEEEISIDKLFKKFPAGD